MTVKTHEPNAKRVTIIGIRKNLMSADGIFSLATWIGVVALGVGVVCACAIAISGKIRDDRLTLALAQSAEKTAAAELQLQQLKFPRLLNVDGFKAAVDKMFPSTVEVLYDANAPDAYFLANSIWGVLFNAHWDTSQQSSGPKPLGPPPLNILPYANMPWTQAAGGSPWGISVVTNEQPAIGKNTLGSDLIDALLQNVKGPTSNGSLGVDHNMPDGKIRIIVGPKLP